MESKMKDKLAVVGAIVLFIGLALQFVKLAWAPYVYLVGACLFAYVQLVSDYKGKNIIIFHLIIWSNNAHQYGAGILDFNGKNIFISSFKTSFESLLNKRRGQT